MVSYDTGTAIHFIVFAIVFTSAFAFAAWRIVRSIEADEPDEENEENDGTK